MINLCTSNDIVTKGWNKAVRTKVPHIISIFLNNSLGYVDDVQIWLNKYGQKAGEDFQQKLEYQSKKSKANMSCFSAKITFDTPGYRTYIFRVVINGKEWFVKQDNNGIPILTTNEDYPFFEVFTYEKNFSTPSWVKGGIMYQIYVDTFNSVNSPSIVAEKLSPWGDEVKWRPDPDGEYRNDKFFGGNLEGIIKKLPYIKELGVNIIYITPIFKSWTSHRYSTVDYDEIDEMVGNWDILEKLYKIAHAHGIYMVLDLVLNHCHPDNKLYVNHKDMFTGYTWWGFADMVEFRQNSDAYKNFLKDFLKKVLRYCDGIRLDVADSLSDEVLRYIRYIVKETETELNKKIYILGEVWKNAVKGDYRGFLFGNELDATMNYQFTDAICWAVRRKGVQAFIQQVFNDVLNLYPKECIDVLMNPLSTHDIPRIQNILINALMLNFKYFDNGSQAFIWDYDKLECWKNDDGIYQTLEKRTWEHANCDIADEEKEQAKKLQKLAVAIQYSLPGVPSIFAGDELGVTGMKDPFNRSCMPWEKVDGNEMHEYYVKIGKVRNEYREIFSTAECKLLYLDEKICIYQRELGKKKLTCIFNLTGQSVIPTKKIIDGKIVFSIYGSSRIRLRPYDAIFVA